MAVISASEGTNINDFRTTGSWVVVNPVGLAAGVYLVEVFSTAASDGVRRILRRWTDMATGAVAGEIIGSAGTESIVGGGIAVDVAATGVSVEAIAGTVGTDVQAVLEDLATRVGVIEAAP